MILIIAQLMRLMDDARTPAELKTRMRLARSYFPLLKLAPKRLDI